jgi:hypothetical protein
MTAYCCPNGPADEEPSSSIAPILQTRQSSPKLPSSVAKLAITAEVDDQVCAGARAGDGPYRRSGLAGCLAEGGRSLIAWGSAFGNEAPDFLYWYVAADPAKLEECLDRFVIYVRRL